MARDQAGPAVVLSFLIAAVASLLSGNIFIACFDNTINLDLHDSDAKQGTFQNSLKIYKNISSI